MISFHRKYCTMPQNVRVGFVNRSLGLRLEVFNNVRELRSAATLSRPTRLHSNDIQPLWLARGRFHRTRESCTAPKPSPPTRPLVAMRDSFSFCSSLSPMTVFSFQNQNLVNAEASLLSNFADTLAMFADRRCTRTAVSSVIDVVARLASQLPRTRRCTGCGLIRCGLCPKVITIAPSSGAYFHIADQQECMYFPMSLTDSTFFTPTDQ